MKVTVAIDSFKGSLTSIEAGEAAKEGILRAVPEAEVLVCPMADGGEGTVDALTAGLGGTFRRIEVTGPAGKPVCAKYGIIPEQQMAVMEMAEAAGITLVDEKERNPLYTTTYGVGELIKDAILQGCRHFLIGIGGSATNDGGVGMLQALGFEFLDANGRPVPFGAIGLSKLDSIRTGASLPQLKECVFRVACDVTNPLCGEAGCSAVYGPQKGATPEMIQQMDRWMQSYASLVERCDSDKSADSPGAGAAGGLGFAFGCFLNASLEPGIQIVIEETHLEEKIAESDYVLVGEGRLDEQSAMGKAPVGIARLSKKLGVPVLAVAGSVAPGAKLCNEAGMDAIFPILREVSSLENAMNPEKAKMNMADTCEQIFRLLTL